ncbi:hybrid sensor histidine kinase/response regulator [Stigmatella erecta]|uniref:histidine kinase n=1 Tax=Stigmatella erecta TaxID=83460 RepID=A0A1I0KP26_9BACT|nr:hybrid sensor histidine kinase/response regulator [Stigmatella erecta]SEU26955.1 Response regulator receiver domain-containing protein [Stigmatella erecta]
MSVRVLQVDDSAADQMMVRRALERDPDTRWAVEQVSSAEEALERATASGPDVVLMDFHLPGMNGVELLRALRERCAGRVPASVLLTGTGNERLAVEAMKSGAQDYLVKGTFTPERLRHSLRAALETVRLERALEARRLQAERAERSAREALAVRDELFALATHDLKGPLQIITLNAQFLRLKMPAASLTPALDTRLTSISHAAMRMGELIDHFLVATRGREQLLRRERMDLLALVNSKVRELESMSSRHAFQLRVEGKDFTGNWDSTSLERVLDNLLSNAVKYSPAGGNIFVTLAEGAAKPERQVMLRVEDSGLGIPAQDLPHVFERFHRASNVPDTIAGSGVGLASVRRLVELHGGTIEVKSQQGQGAAFTVRLPQDIPVDRGSPESGAGPSQDMR